ncbi:hypothetical protein [Bauldia litoralis]|uniref:hypothetical protein n=1 Tax=Bauldia litoralis TaxID=665467 RepID=UPI00326624B6
MKTGSGALLIWNDIAPGAEAIFRGWHDDEHIPERVAVPGFLHGRRLFSANAAPRWLTFYEADTASVFSSPAYLARLDSPTPRTVAILPSFRATQRMAGDVVAAVGEGRGKAVGTTRIWSPGIDADAETLRPLLSATLARPGVVAVAVVASDAAGTQRATAERSLRAPDEAPPDIVLVVEAASENAIPDLRAETAALFPGAGRIAADRYAVEFALASA